MQRSSLSQNVVPIIATIGAIALYSSIVMGQLLRIPIFGQSGGLLLSDIAVPLFLGCAGLLIMMRAVDTRAIYRAGWMYLTLIGPFFVYSIGILLIHSQSLGGRELAIALLYWLRLWVISLLLPVCIVVLSVQGIKQLFLRGFLITYCLLLSIGYVQLVIFPSLVGNLNGWDPHIHRMIATWFDPNFFGGYIALCIFPVFVWSKRNVFLGIAGIVALILTQSRSAWMAFVIGCVLVGCVVLIRSSLAPLWKKIITIGCVGGCLVVIAIVALAPGRISQLFTHDPTASLRISSYSATWHQLVEPYGVFGVGYNAYQFYAKRAGLIRDFSAHSRAGSDSSIMTLLVTTGIIGTFLFLAPFIVGVWFHVSKWCMGGSKNHLVFLWAAIILLVHAQFENSLLYPHILIPLSLLAAIVSV